MARLLCIGGGGFRHRVVAGPKGPWPGLAGLRRGLCAPAVLAMLGERGCGKAEGFRFRNLWTPDAIAALFGALLGPGCLPRRRIPQGPAKPVRPRRAGNARRGPDASVLLDGATASSMESARQACQ